MTDIVAFFRSRTDQVFTVSDVWSMTRSNSSEAELALNAKLNAGGQMTGLDIALAIESSSQVVELRVLNLQGRELLSIIDGNVFEFLGDTPDIPNDLLKHGR
ncbi:MAG: hypothetical protein CL534_19040 [Ahrensia sp.]|nr:hypothetical protein [Ahrensia sp.]